MIWALSATVMWLVLANLIALLTCVNRQRLAHLSLVVVGIPILGWVTWVNGPIVGGIVLAIGCAALRWPLPRLAGVAPRYPAQEPAE